MPDSGPWSVLTRERKMDACTSSERKSFSSHAVDRHLQ